MDHVQFVHRAANIAADFNAIEYDAEGKAGRSHTDETKKLIAAMLKEKHSSYDATGKKIMLALEISFIVQAIRSDEARAHFHRVLQWF